jgi:hypothetical protein
MYVHILRHMLTTMYAATVYAKFGMNVLNWLPALQPDIDEVVIYSRELLRYNITQTFKF